MTKTTTIHRLIVLLQHYKSIRLSIIFFIDLLNYNYLSPKARRKWSILCSGRTHVISHFTIRHIFVTYCDTIALFRKITINTTRPSTIFKAILHKLHNLPIVSYYYLVFSHIFSFYLIRKRPHISLLLLLFPINNKAVISSELKTTTQFIMFIHYTYSLSFFLSLLLNIQT